MLTAKYSDEAEKGVLGAVLLEGISGESKALKKIALRPDDFFKSDHKLIFTAFLKLEAVNLPVDFVTLDGLLEQEHIQRLKTIARDTPTTANLKYHADIVRDKAGLRRFQKICLKVLGDIESGQIDDPGVAVMNLSAGMKSLIQSRTGDVLSMKDVVKTTIDSVEERFFNKGRLSGLPSGFSQLDKLTDGLQQGNLIVIAGRPGQGKTTLSMNIVESVARTGAAVGVINLEMSPKQLGTKALSSSSGVPLWALQKGLMRQQEWSKLHSAAAHLVELNIYFSFTARTLKAVQSEIAGLVENKGCEIVVLDYLQLVSNPAEKIRELEVGSVSSMLKEMALSMNIPIVVLSSLNREVEKRPDRRPHLSDLRESGRVEFDADVIIFVYPSKEENIQIVEIGKGRTIGTGNVELYWDKERSCFRDKEMGSDEEESF